MPTTAADIIASAHRKVGAALPDYLPDYANDLLRNGFLLMLNDLSRDAVDDTVASRLAKFLAVEQLFTVTPVNTAVIQDAFRIKSVKVKRAVFKTNIINFSQPSQSGYFNEFEMEHMLPGRYNIEIRIIENGVPKDIFVDSVGYLKYATKGQLQGNISAPILVLQEAYCEAINPTSFTEYGSEPSWLFPRYTVRTFGTTGQRAVQIFPLNMEVINIWVTYVRYPQVWPNYASPADLELVYPIDVLTLLADYVAKEYALNTNAYNKYGGQSNLIREGS